MAKENETTVVRKIENGHIIRTEFYDTRAQRYTTKEVFTPTDPFAKAKMKAPAKKTLQKAATPKKK